jgi:hypothetical protein
MTFQIFLKGLEGRTICIHGDNFSVETTVEDLKKLIQQKEGIPEDVQRLIFSGKEMMEILHPTNEKALLKDYNIQRDSTIHLVIRLLGGLQLEVKYETDDGKQ